jgi:hypothetical protein
MFNNALRDDSPICVKVAYFILNQIKDKIERIIGDEMKNLKDKIIDYNKYAQYEAYKISIIPEELTDDFVYNKLNFACSFLRDRAGDKGKAAIKAIEATKAAARGGGRSRSNIMKAGRGEKAEDSSLLVILNEEEKNKLAKEEEEKNKLAKEEEEKNKLAKEEEEKNKLSKEIKEIKK